MGKSGVSAIALVLVAACGGAAPPMRPASTPTVAARPVAAAAPAKPDLPSSSLRRSAVAQTVAAGLGSFLQNVAVDDRPVFLSGKFHGFRITALRGPLQGIALKPGDVVVRVNGMPIEHPEEALEVFRAIEISSELRVDFERDGEPHELRYAIVDD